MDLTRVAIGLDHFYHGQHVLLLYPSPIDSRVGQHATGQVINVLFIENSQMCVLLGANAVCSGIVRNRCHKIQTGV